MENSPGMRQNALCHYDDVITLRSSLSYVCAHALSQAWNNPMPSSTVTNSCGGETESGTIAIWKIITHPSTKIFLLCDYFFTQVYHFAALQSEHVLDTTIKPGNKF